MGAVRLFTLEWFPAWEYSRPSFPEDPLGMSNNERLRLAKACIRFLNLPYKSNLLVTLQYEDGSVVFNQRELSHMDDVKLVYDRMTISVSLIFLLVTGLAVIKIIQGKTEMVFNALSWGGVVTTSVLILIGMWILVGFNAFFTAFHGLFFSEGTWLFYSTDSLIRLFPLKFWQDAGIGITLVVIGSSLFLGWFGRRLAKRYSSTLAD
jgi:integral membrane protein (TIGR01906 family)